MTKTTIIVTGLPASGKTTLGRRVASALGRPYLDKDDYLEALYETAPVPDRAARRRLSRRGDEAFIADARRAPGAVLVSHWRNAACGPDAGTPTDWLRDAHDGIIELYCPCPVDEAARRFRARVRHPGHRDMDRTLADLTDWFTAYGAALPLGLGTLVERDAGPEDGFRALVARLAALLGEEDA